MTTVPTNGPATGPSRPPDALRMTPGRWVTLLIGVPIALAFIGWSGFGLVADIGQASFPVSATIPVEHGRLVASTGGGDITVHQGQLSGGAARLTGTVRYSLVRPHFTANDSGVSLHCGLPTGNCGLNATLDVPPRTMLDLTSGGGNMQVSAIQGNVTLNSGGGDVDGSGLFSRHVTMSTGGGNVSLVFTQVPDDVRISSSGGDVTIVLPHGSTSYAIQSNAGGGDYHASVPTNDASGHKIKLDTGGGNISIAQAS